MCDDLTDGDGTGTGTGAGTGAGGNDGTRAEGISRRAFAALGAAAALAGCAGATARPARALRERMVQVTTPDGTADAFLVHPASGTHPAVILWPDIGGLREVFRAMARRLAESGYAVLAVNQYYRSAPAPVLDSFAQWQTPEGKAKLKPMIAAVTPAATLRDAAAFVAFLDAEAAVDKARGIGTQGYCMGGPHAVRTAAAVPGRIGAVASFHGAGLVTRDADSPAGLIARTGARYLFAVARNDDARQPEAAGALRAACAGAGRPAEVEVYPADHGWCVADAPAFDAAQAERAWGRLLALYAML